MAIMARRAGLALAIGLLGAGAAQADVTARQVWENWQETLSGSGSGEVTFDSEDMEGDRLTVTGVGLDVEEEGTTVTAELGTLVFVENGDGTVSVELPGEMPVAIEASEPGEGTTTLTMAVTQQGADIQVSGTPGEMTYDMSADRYGIRLDPVEDLDETSINAGSLELEGVESSYTVTEGGEMRDVDSNASAETMTLTLDVEETGGPSAFKMLATIEDITSEARMTAPLDLSEQSGEEVFVQGLGFDVSYESGPTDYSFTATDAEGSVEGTGTSEGGTFSIAMDQDGASYSGSAEAPTLSMSGSKLPMPIEASMEGYNYAIEMPLSSSEETRSFGLELGLNELSLNEEVWAAFDPQGQLPHDPATVRLDLDGEGRLFFDLMNPEQAEAAMMADVPGELESLTLQELTVRFAGAEITGDGNFTFDNSDLETFGGMPAPEGSVTLRAEGLNALIDSLAGMGLLPQEQVMGARMMLGMFARSTGDDQLESTLEVNGEGQVIANGQRIR